MRLLISMQAGGPRQLKGRLSVPATRECSTAFHVLRLG